MADNTRGGSQDSSNPLIATDEVTYSGDVADVQLMKVVAVSGAEGSKTVVEISDATTGQYVGGNVAHDAADSGNPVKIGGKAVDYEAMPTAVTVGDRVNASYTPQGIAAVALFDAGTGTTIATLPVSVTSIGDVPLAAGDNNIGDVDVVSLPALPAGTNNIGDVDVLTLPGVAGDVAHDAADSGNPVKIGGHARSAVGAAVADGDRVDAWYGRYGQQVVAVGSGLTPGDGAANTEVDPFNEGTGAAGKLGVFPYVFNGTTWDRFRGDVANGLDVDVTRLPALVAGSANIGDVDVLTVPADPFGVNADAAVAAGATGSIQAKLRRLTTDIDAIKTSVAAATPAGTNNIGDVDVLSLPALVAGSAAIGKLAANSGVDIGDVDVLSITPGTGATNQGKAIDTAVGATDTGVGALVKRLDTPVTLTPASGDWVPLQVNSMGEQYVVNAPHFGLVGDPYTLQPKTAQYTTTQTGVALWTPTGGKKLVITKVQIQAGGTVAGTVQLWFGGSADTTYTRGTDRAIFDGEFAPSATSKPGVVMDGPWIAGAADDILRVTDSAAVNPLTVTAWGYEI